jgi:phosphoribosylanthranilate isomerase
MAALKIKICGVRRAGDVRRAALLGVHAVGINFVPESPRYIGDVSAAQKLIDESSAPGMIWAGVYVNAELDFITHSVKTLKLGIVQLHGEESPEFVQRVKSALGNDVAVWKALRAATIQDLKAMNDYDCAGFVVDAKVAGVRGGSGQTFDWSILKGVSRKSPLILSGGLKPSNVGGAVAMVRPDWVDVASGVETKPGVKSPELIQQFVLNARMAADITEATGTGGAGASSGTIGAVGA